MLYSAPHVHERKYVVHQDTLLTSDLSATMVHSAQLYRESALCTRACSWLHWFQVCLSMWHAKLLHNTLQPADVDQAASSRAACRGKLNLTEHCVQQQVPGCAASDCRPCACTRPTIALDSCWQRKMPCACQQPFHGTVMFVGGGIRSHRFLAAGLLCTGQVTCEPYRLLASAQSRHPAASTDAAGRAGMVN